MIKVKILKDDSAKDLPLPRYMTAGSSGMDICANATVILKPGEWVAIPTGLFVAVPNGFELQIRPRSGMAAKHGVTVLNSPGTIDADYRGEIKVLLINHSHEPYQVERGSRVAQMVLSSVPIMLLEETDALPATKRNKGGFGHTGE